MMRTSRSRSIVDNQVDGKQGEGKAANVGQKRRALGDITNASSMDDGKEATKKVATMPVVSLNMNMMVDDEPMSMQPERSYMQRPSDDIDSRDASNPLLVSTYVNSMYDHFGAVERQYMINAKYMLSQPYINDKMRCILIDWLVEVHLKFKMVPETLYMTVSIIDRYLQFKQVRRSRLQLVGVAAFLISAKYEEIYPPEFSELVYVTDRAYNKKEIMEMESDIAITLNYDLTVPTTHSFLCRHLKAAHADRAMVQLSCYLAERTLQEYAMIKYLPSVIAAASVLVARKSLRRHPWSPTLLAYTGYDEEDLAACIQEMQMIMNASSQQQAVVRKYSHPKFGTVAKLPLTF